MARIWANRLEAGDKTWANVPNSRKDAVKVILREDVENHHNGMNAERYTEITGEPYEM